MNCSDFLATMSAELDGELDAATALRMREHGGACAGCHAAYAQLGALRATLRQHATQYAAPAQLRSRIRAAVRAEQTPRRRLAALPWAWINLAAAGVAGAAWALTLALYLAQPSAGERLDQELVASHFRSLMPDHLADVASSDQHTVKPWFSGRLDFSPPVVDLKQQGYALVGGRLDYIGQRPVAALAYRHRAHVLNLYLWPEPAPRDAAPHASASAGFHLLQWRQGGMHYTAVSDMNAQDLSQFAGMLREQVGQGSAQ